MTEMTQMTKALGPIARAHDAVIGAEPSGEGAIAEIPKETVLELKRSRLHGLEREVTRAVLTGAPREDIEEVIDTSLASDAEKAALRHYSWSLLSCFEAHRAGGERRTA